MTDSERDDNLDDMFEAARREAPMPSAALLARVLEDARREQPQPTAAKPRARRGFGLWLDALGGWGGLGGLAAASSFGIWLGVSSGLGVSDLGGFVAAETGTSALDAEFIYLADLGDL